MKSREAFIKHMVYTEANKRINEEHKREHRIVDGYYDTFSKTVSKKRYEVFCEYLAAQEANYREKLAKDMAAKSASVTSKAKKKDKKNMEKEH